MKKQGESFAVAGKSWTVWECADRDVQRIDETRWWSAWSFEMMDWLRVAMTS